MNALAERLARLGLGPAAVVDVASVIHGVRPAGLFHLPSSLDPELDGVLHSCGLSVAHRRVLRRNRDPLTHDSLLENDDASCAAPRADRASSRWSETWFVPAGSARPDAEELEARTGEMLGYPDCCVAANRRCVSLQPYYAGYLGSGIEALWQVNRLATAITGARLLPDYFPCGLRCGRSRSLAEQCMVAVRREVGDAWAGSMAADLQAPLTLWGGSLMLWRHWSSDGGMLELRSTGVVSVPLSSIARMPPSSLPSPGTPALVPFEHLGRPHAARIVASDGSAAEVPLTLLH